MNFRSYASARALGVLVLALAAPVQAANNLVDFGAIIPNATVTSGNFNVQKNPGTEIDVFQFDFTQSVNGILSVQFDPQVANNNGVPLATIGTVSLWKWNGSSFAQLSSMQATFNANGPGDADNTYSASFSGVFAPGARLTSSDYELQVQASATGNQTSQFALTLTAGPAVAPIPEPHEWAMMLAGLGVVGWVARRRNAASPA